jgi:hypothetical protein
MLKMNALFARIPTTMQKNILGKSLIYIVLITLTVTSCNDDDKKLCTVVSVNANVADGNYNSTYTYDNGRLIKQISTFVGTMSGTIEASYVYDSEGRLTELKASSYYANKFSYNSNGNIIVSDEYYGTTLMDRAEYEYTNGRITKVQFYEQGNGGIVKRNYDEFTYANPSEQGASKIIHFDADGTISSVTEYEYDTRKVKIPRGMEAVYQLLLLDGNGLEHNVTKKIDTFGTSPNLVTTTTFAYKFNEDGYTTQVVETATMGSNTETFTTNFNYNCK